MSSFAQTPQPGSLLGTALEELGARLSRLERGDAFGPGIDSAQADLREALDRLRELAGPPRGNAHGRRS